MIAEIERRERERTGIPSLKVRYNRVFGYYIEVTKAQQERVPSDYMRKQTLVGAERFTTPELKEFEEQVVGADEKIALREYDLFQGLCAAVTQSAARIQRTARAVAGLDCLSALAETGVRRNYVLPTVDDSREIEIQDGRHPVVEALGSDRFVPNDTRLAPQAPIHVITGPNMAGKSTYMRQVALIVVLAQAGAPSPPPPRGSASLTASSPGSARLTTSRAARAPSWSRWPRRHRSSVRPPIGVWSSSTRSAGARRRSTAWGSPGPWPRTLRDASAPARSSPRTITSLRNFRSPARASSITGSPSANGGPDRFPAQDRGRGADKSYGIHVGRLAGLPEPVIARAREILANLEASAITSNGEPRLARRAEGTGQPSGPPQLNLFGEKEDRIARELDSLDLERLTPIEALNLLHKWRSGG